MFKICIAICVLSYFAGTCASETVHCGKRIEGSSKVPWHVIIHSNDSSSESPDCGGTIMNNLYVITAAHCLFDLSGNAIARNLLRVLIHRRNGTEELWIAKIFLQREFTTESFEVAIAVLKLKSPIEFDDDVEPVCFMESSQFMTTEVITIPIASEGSSESRVVQWKVTDQTLCHGTNRYIFESSFNHTVCMGNLLRTDKFQLNRGSGMVVQRNGSWHLVGVLLYTTGPAENISTYGGGIDIFPFYNWVDRTISRHLKPSITDIKCQYYKEIAKSPKSHNFRPHIALIGKGNYISEDVCYGTLISERFILTAAICGRKSLDGIFLKSDFTERTYYNDYKFHFHPEDGYRKGIALIELNRNASNMEYFIHCLWTNEKDSLQFTTELVHGMRLFTTATITVNYKPKQDVSMQFDDNCSWYTADVLYKPGDALATQHNNETVKRVVGLVDKQIENCRPINAVNVVDYVPWIEEIVWGK